MKYNNRTYFYGEVYDTNTWHSRNTLFLFFRFRLWWTDWNKLCVIFLFWRRHDEVGRFHERLTEKSEVLESPGDPRRVKTQQPEEPTRHQRRTRTWTNFWRWNRWWTSWTAASGRGCSTCARASTRTPATRPWRTSWAGRCWTPTWVSCCWGNCWCNCDASTSSGGCVRPAEPRRRGLCPADILSRPSGKTSFRTHCFLAQHSVCFKRVLLFFFKI